MRFINRIAAQFTAAKLIGGNQRPPPASSHADPGPVSPWVDIACRAGLEWFRDHKTGPDVDYDDWVRDKYIPGLLEGIGLSPDTEFDLLTAREVDTLDAAGAGLEKARDLHRRRQEYRRRSDGVIDIAGWKSGPAKEWSNPL